MKPVSALVPSPRERLLQWVQRGEPFALATVCGLSGSAPRGVGATLLVSAEGDRFEGSVSAGCLENDLIARVPEVMSRGVGSFVSFGPEGAEPWSEGLSCGGRLRLRLDPWFAWMAREPMLLLASGLRTWLETGRVFALLSRGQAHAAFTPEGESVGDVGGFSTDAVETALQRLQAGAASYALDAVDLYPNREDARSAAWPGLQAERTLLVRLFHRAPRLIVVGAVDTAAYLCAFASSAGFEVLVVDPRAHYATAERFPVPPQQRQVGWPKDFSGLALGARDAALVLTHDPKIDDVALRALLQTRVGYIGALGSRRSHALRRERLLAEGESEASLGRIEGPAGLKLGSAEPVGIALGMLAGVVRAQVERGQWT